MNTRPTTIHLDTLTRSRLKFRAEVLGKSISRFGAELIEEALMPTPKGLFKDRVASCIGLTLMCAAFLVIGIALGMTR